MDFGELNWRPLDLMKARKTVLNLKVNVRYALIIFVLWLGLSCLLTDRNQTDGLINDSISESESKKNK